MTALWYWLIVMLFALCGAKMRAFRAAGLMLVSGFTLYFAAWSLPGWGKIGEYLLPQYPQYHRFAGFLPGVLILGTAATVLWRLLGKIGKTESVQLPSDRYENVSGLAGLLCGAVSGMLISGGLCLLLALSPAVDRVPLTHPKDLGDLAYHTVTKMSRVVNLFANDRRTWAQRQDEYLTQILSEVRREPKPVEPEKIVPKLPPRRRRAPKPEVAPPAPENSGVPATEVVVVQTDGGAAASGNN